jgi:phosphoglycolate phosphatase
VRHILPDRYRDAGTVAEVLAAINRDYRRHWADATCPYDGIPALLDVLTERRIRMAVLSNKPDDFARLSVSRLLPAWRFELVWGNRPGIPPKPDPAGALAVASTLSIAPEEFLYLGDTGVDMRTATAAGMEAVGALWGYRSPDELTASGAKVLFAKPADLAALL